MAGESKFHLVITTPLKKYAELDIESMSLYTRSGEITLLSHHIDLIANVEIGPLIIKRNGRLYHYAMEAGVLYFDMAKNTANLIVNSIESFDEIDLEQAMKDKEKAEKLLGEAKTTKEAHDAEIHLKSSVNRINVKNNYGC